MRAVTLSVRSRIVVTLDWRKFIRDLHGQAVLLILFVSHEFQIFHLVVEGGIKTISDIADVTGEVLFKFRHYVGLVFFVFLTRWTVDQVCRVPLLALTLRGEAVLFIERWVSFCTECLFNAVAGLEAFLTVPCPVAMPTTSQAKVILHSHRIQRLYWLNEGVWVSLYLWLVV